MKFENHTPFASLSWESINAKNEWSVSTIVRVKFKFHKSDNKDTWDLKFHPDQGELFGADVFYGETGESSVQYESDYVSFKPNTDVIINANAHAPKGKPTASWDCGVRIYNDKNILLKEYGLKIKSEKKQYKVGPLWASLGVDSESCVQVRYEKAYGGSIKIPAKEEGKKDKYLKYNAYNPIGCGIYKMRDPKKEQFSPQISYLGKKVKKVPAGFGFIHRAWKSRLPYAGTYDQDWIDNQHPLPPHDFDAYHNQGAHPNLIMQGYLKGEVKINLTNLMYAHDAPQDIVLPECVPISRLRTPTGDIYNELNLDTLIIDVDSEDVEDWAVYASYRNNIFNSQTILASETMLLSEKN